MHWKVRIKGDDFDLKLLAEGLSGDDLSITMEDDGYYLRSSSFKELDAEAVRDEANRIASLLSGAARLTLDANKPIEVGHLTKVSEDGGRQVFVKPDDNTLKISSHVSATVGSSDGTVEQIKKTDSLSDFMSAGRCDDSAAKVLRLLGQGPPNWSMMYRIYEVIESDVGGRAEIVDRGWATDNAITRFKRTANSPSITGDESRHGAVSTEPPPNPMSTSEACSLLRMVAHEWLNAKQTSS